MVFVQSSLFSPDVGKQFMSELLTRLSSRFEYIGVLRETAVQDLIQFEKVTPMPDQRDLFERVFDLFHSKVENRSFYCASFNARLDLLIERWAAVDPNDVENLVRSQMAKSSLFIGQPGAAQEGSVMMEGGSTSDISRKTVPKSTQCLHSSGALTER